MVGSAVCEISTRGVALETNTCTQRHTSDSEPIQLGWLTSSAVPLFDIIIECWNGDLKQLSPDVIYYLRLVHLLVDI